MLIALAATLALVPAPQAPTPTPPSTPTPTPTVGPPAATQGGLELEPIGDSGARARFVALPGVPDVTLWLGVHVGWAHDPLGQSGLAQVIGQAIRADMPPSSDASPREVSVVADTTLVGVTVPRADAPAELARFARWLTGDLRLDHDALLHARGRALLRADDELDVLPGPVLRDRARRVECEGTPWARPPAGIPDQIRELEPAAVRARLADTWRPGRAFLVVLGACDDDLRAAATAALGKPGGTEAPIGPLAEPLPEPSAGTAADVELVTPHDRVAAPFVALALPAPHWGEAGYLPFLVAIEVARTRAARTFATLRGGELEAEFPPVFYDPVRMPPLAFIERRGRDTDDVARVEEELRSFAAGLRAGGAAAGEIRGAIVSLLNRLALPPFKDAEIDVMRRYPAFLHQRGGILASYIVHGWPADLPASLGAVPVTDVQRELQALFAEDHGRFLALTPE